MSSLPGQSRISAGRPGSRRGSDAPQGDFDLTQAAEEDLTGTWLHTLATWGLDQADKYFDLIGTCCEAVGRRMALSKPVGRLTGSIRVHRCAQHYIFFIDNTRPVVLAILHGRMDFLERLKERF
ncbi:type II toxin-antitoxin system RelE/ParE family toxin [Nisaea sp.]|uniref:type II toxin-antitoxin system RelE/ParE family toxin n=1 Tax=Nisaea sp. TaxID=2024842 RepID=UPI0032993AF6